MDNVKIEEYLNDFEQCRQRIHDVLTVSNTVLEERGSTAATELEQLPDKIADLPSAEVICSVRTVRGIHTQEQESTSLTVNDLPANAKQIIITPAQTTAEVGLLHYGSAIYTEQQDNTFSKNTFFTLDTTGNKSWGAGNTTATFADGTLTIPQYNSRYLWKGPLDYRWTARVWEEELDEYIASLPVGQEVSVDGQAHYGSDISTAEISFPAGKRIGTNVEEGQIGQNVTMYLIPIENGNYRAALLGVGETVSFPHKGATPWDAYANQITEVFIGNGITTIGGRMFHRLARLKKVICISDVLDSVGVAAFYNNFSLNKITGFNKVTTLGQGAFFNCPSLNQVDLDTEMLSSVMGFAFACSSVEDSLSLPAEGYGSEASRADRWDSEALRNIQAYSYPTSIQLPCANAEMHQNYRNINSFKGCVGQGNEYKEPTISKGGCNALTMYHAYNSIHARDGKACPSFYHFWFNILKADDGVHEYNHRYNENAVEIDMMPWFVQNTAEKVYVKEATIFESVAKENDGTYIWENLRAGVRYEKDAEGKEHLWCLLTRIQNGTDEYESMGAMCQQLGWNMEKQIITSVNQKMAIYDQLRKGIPVPCGVNHMERNNGNDEASHEVLIIGCDRETDKLTIVDSTWSSGDTAHIYSLAFEDMFFGATEADPDPSNTIILLTVEPQEESEETE